MPEPSPAEFVLMCGLPGSGKSTLAKGYSVLGYRVVTAGLNPGENEMALREALYQRSGPLVYDGCSSFRAFRRRVLKLAKRLGYATRIVYRDATPAQALLSRAPQIIRQYLRFQKPRLGEADALDIAPFHPRS